MTLLEREKLWKNWPQGDAGDAIDFACDHVTSGSFEAMLFLEAWREGRANEWLEYMDWLNVQRDGTRESLRTRSTQEGDDNVRT